jgi:hypothetical protein
VRDTIIPQLLPNEYVMCDKGYLAEPRCITPPKGTYESLSYEEKNLFVTITRIRQLNERVIGRLSLWGFFQKKWNLTYEFHELCAKVIAKLTQLELYHSPLT